MRRIYRLCYAADKLQSRIVSSTAKHKLPSVERTPTETPKQRVAATAKVRSPREQKKRTRYKMRRAFRRIHARITNLVDDLHKRLCKWLVQEHTLVLLPKFETSQMLRRGQRRIRSKTARAMATWSHYRFQQRLIAKVREYPWCRVEIVSEAYTSKTCGCCGTLHHKLGGNKVFRCPNRSCGIRCDRDLHAARNILLRYMQTQNEKNGHAISRDHVEAWLQRRNHY